MLRRRTKAATPAAVAAGFTLAETARMAHDLEALRNATHAVVNGWADQHTPADFGDEVAALAGELYRQTVKIPKAVL